MHLNFFAVLFIQVNIVDFVSCVGFYVHDR